jgi:Transcriptional regulator, AbiEi antitoxin
MDYKNHHSERAAQCWSLAKQQHGVIARTQLLDLGLHSQAITHRIASGRLHQVRRGVYAVGRPQLTQHGRWMAAVLSCGPGAVLSHGSAAGLWEIGSKRGRIEVSVPSRTPRRRDGILAHRRPALGANDVAIHHGIPVTTPVRTLVDLATRLGRGRLERAIREADARGLVDPETLRAALGDLRGQRGVAALRETRPPNLRAHRLRARARLSADRTPGWAAGARDTTHGQRVQSRLFLARVGSDRRDRRPALSPYAGAAGCRPGARPGAHRRGADTAAFHARTGAIRATARRGNPAHNLPTPPRGIEDRS